MTIFKNGNAVQERTKLSKNGYIFQEKGVTASGNSVLIETIHYWIISLIIENDYRYARIRRDHVVGSFGFPYKEM